MFVRIIIAAVMLVGLFFTEELPWYIQLGICLVPYLLVGYDILWKAVHNILHGQVFDENFLMVVATIGALGVGEYHEAVGVMLFYQVGEFFQSYAVGKSRRNISELMDIRPDYANVMQGDELVKTDPTEVAVGDIIYVRTGEKIPIDGIIEEGESALNTAALTGESVPRDVAPGDEVISGCINLTGLLRIRTTKLFGESTASKILELVENAGYNKAQSEAFITRFAKYYTPIVCFAALAVAVLPPLVRMFFMDLPAEWTDWLMRALTFLVISCPCALVISIPLSFFAGIGGASNKGVLIKGANYLEALAKTKAVAFDKTGTMTKGIFDVSLVHHCAIAEQHLLEFVAHAESFSNHPISQGLVRAYKGTVDKSRVENVREFPGQGVIAEVDGLTVIVGNEKLLTSQHVEVFPCDEPGSNVHVAIDGAYFGHIHIQDVIKPTAKDAIAALKKCGVGSWSC